MRRLSLAVIAMVVVATAPAVANAGFIVEASLGRGGQVSPHIDKAWGPANLLIAPGYGLGEMIRAELGFVMDLPNNGVGTNLRLRPMLVIDPPVIPIYGRLIVGIANLVDGDRAYEFGGALGVGGSIAGVGLFAEVGAVPQSVDGDFITVLEGRAGGYLSF